MPGALSELTRGRNLERTHFGQVSSVISVLEDISTTQMTCKFMIRVDQPPAQSSDAQVLLVWCVNMRVELLVAVDVGSELSEDDSLGHWKNMQTPRSAAKVMYQLSDVDSGNIMP